MNRNESAYAFIHEYYQGRSYDALSNVMSVLYSTFIRKLKTSLEEERTAAHYNIIFYKLTI